MNKMYKVYFNNRVVYLDDNYKTNFDKFDGLFYKYNNKADFEKFWEFFEALSSNVTNLFIVGDNVEQLKEDFFSFFHVINAAGGVVINDKQQILVIKRFGKWDLPKGKVEDKEELKTAAVREISEECGISNLEITKQLTTTYHTYYLNNKQILKQTYWYAVKYSGNEKLQPQLEEDITEAKWFDEDKISAILENTYKSIVDVLVNAEKLVVMRNIN